MRHLADRARERDRQLASGVHVAEQHVGDRVPGLGTWKPRLEDRRHVLGDPADRQRPAVHQHDRDRLPGCVHGLHQVELRAGQIERAARRRLAAHLARLADRHHDDIGRACRATASSNPAVELAGDLVRRAV